MKRLIKKCELGNILETPIEMVDYSLPPTNNVTTNSENLFTNSYIVNGLLKSRPLNWNTFDAIYNKGKSSKIPYNTLMGIMASIALESGGYEDSKLINWNHKKGLPWTYLTNGGTGLIQWTGTNVPKDLIQAIFNDIITPYNSLTNYWKGNDTYRSGLYKGLYSPLDSAMHYRTYRIRPGVFNKSKLITALNMFLKKYKKY